MRVVAVSLGVAVDVAVREDVTLLLAAAAGSIHRERTGQGDQASDEAYQDRCAEETEVEIGVKRLVLESIHVRYLPEVRYPVEEPARELGGSFATEALLLADPRTCARWVSAIHLSEAPKICSWGIESSLAPTENQKDTQVDGRHDSHGDQCRDHTYTRDSISL